MLQWYFENGNTTRALLMRFYSKYIVVPNTWSLQALCIIADLAPVRWGALLLALGGSFSCALVPAHQLALLLRLFQAHLPGDVLARSLGHLLRHLLALLALNVLANLLWHSTTWLPWHLVADLSGDLFGDISALLFWHLSALLAWHVLADITWHITALLFGHLDGHSVANILYHIWNEINLSLLQISKADTQLDKYFLFMLLEHAYSVLILRLDYA